jgi:hypothetical protein
MQCNEEAAENRRKLPVRGECGRSCAYRRGPVKDADDAHETPGHAGCAAF